MTANPLDDSDPTRQQRIRERAYHLWESEGRPEGRDAEYWERARELVGIEESPAAGQVPVREEAFLRENLGEFPDRTADQGERQVTLAKPARTPARPAAKSAKASRQPSAP